MPEGIDTVYFLRVETTSETTSNSDGTQGPGIESGLIDIMRIDPVGRSQEFIAL